MLNMFVIHYHEKKDRLSLSCETGNEYKNGHNQGHDIKMSGIVYFCQKTGHIRSSHHILLQAKKTPKITVTQ